MYISCSIDIGFNETLSTSDLFGALAFLQEKLGDKYKQDEYKMHETPDNRFSMIPLKTRVFKQFIIENQDTECLFERVVIREDRLSFRLVKTFSKEIRETLSEIASAVIKKAGLLDGVCSILITIHSNKKHARRSLPEAINENRFYDQMFTQSTDMNIPEIANKDIPCLFECRTMSGHTSDDQQYYSTLVKTYLNPPLLGYVSPIVGTLDPILSIKINKLVENSFSHALAIMKTLVVE